MFKLKIIDKPEMFKMKCNFEFPKIPIENLQEKEVNPTTEKQEIVADKEYSALSKVTINPIPDEYIIPSGEIEINANGNYNVTDKASAKVNVPAKQLGTKTITKNGVYNANNDNLDGYSQVTVATSGGVDINDYFTTTLSTDGQMSNKHWKVYFKKLPPVTISGTSAEYLFYSFPLPEHPDISANTQITNINGLFYYAKITEVKPFDTSKCTTANALFGYCSFLQKIPKLNFENLASINTICSSCISLEIVGGFENLGKAYKATASANSLIYGLDLSNSKKLTHESLMNVINNLYDIASIGVKTQQLTIGSTNLAKLTAEEIQIATDKGFSVS